MRTREAILDAATAEFARHGYHAVTMKDIASAAGYTAPSLYNYFASKEEIFSALLERIHEAFVGVFDEPVPAGLTFSQRLELLVRRQLDVHERHRDSFALFMKHSEAMPSKALARWRQESFTAFLERLTRWMAESASPEDLAQHDAETLAFHFWGTMTAHHARSLLGRETELDPHVLTQRIMALFLHGARGR